MAIRAAMHEIVTETPWFGYRPMTKALRRALRIEINEKRVRRLMKLDGLIASRKTVRRWLSPKHGFPRYPNLAADLVPTAINQLWVADLTYVRLRSTFVFVAVVLDAFSRRCVGWSLMTIWRRAGDRRSQDGAATSAAGAGSGRSLRSGRAVRLQRIRCVT